MIEILNGTHETVAYRDMKGIKAFMNTDPEDFPLHWHTALELIMPIKNGYTVRTNGETIRFSPGDIILIPPGELHSLHAPEEGERMIMQFDYSLLCNLAGMDSLLHMLRPYRLIRAGQSDGLGETLRGYLEEIMAEYTGEDPFREPVSILCFFDFLWLWDAGVWWKEINFPIFLPASSRNISKNSCPSAVISTTTARKR